MKKWTIIIITVCITASLIAFVSATDFEKVVTSIQRVGFKFAILLLVTFIAYLFGTISWKYCLGENSRRISTKKLFVIRHIGETVSLFNPASIIGGDTLKTFLLREYAIANKTVVVSVLCSRIIMVLSQLTLFLTAVSILVLQHPAYKMGINRLKIAFVFLIFSLLIAGLASFYYRLEHRNFSSRSGNYVQLNSKWLRLKIRELRLELNMLLIQNKRMLLFSFAFAIVHWIFGSLEFYFILKFLGVKVSIMEAIVVDMGVVFFKAAGAFIPGQLGVEEYGNKIMLMAIGIPGTEIWITASVLRRARQLVWTVFGIGVYFLLFKGAFMHDRYKNGVIVHQP